MQVFLRRARRGVVSENLRTAGVLHYANRDRYSGSTSRRNRSASRATDRPIGLGTGSGTKTRILIDALEKPAVYIPVDISEKQLRKSTALFHKIFPDLEILPVCADYLQPVALPSPSRKATRNVVYFPGSTIGNFGPDEA